MAQVEICHLFVFGLAIDHTPPNIECYKLQDVIRTVPNAYGFSILGRILKKSRVAG